MICAPDASCASFMMSKDEYFPVPTMRREENSLPPSTRFVSLMALPSSPLAAWRDATQLAPPPTHLTTRLVARRHSARTATDPSHRSPRGATPLSSHRHPSAGRTPP